MLTDHEISSLRTNRRYRRLLRVGLKRLGSDIIACGDGEFRTDASFGMKFLYAFTRSRIIRSELAATSDAFLQKFLDAELQWPRSPQSVQSLCDHHAHRFVWMRYDEPRVVALLRHCEHVLTDAEFRDLVKHSSSLERDKNARLRELLSELHLLLDSTVRSIRSQGLFNGLITMQKDEYYKIHEQDIQEKFLSAADGGVLGLPPPSEQEKNNEQ